MTLEQFRQSLADDTPPAGLRPLLVALWHEGRGGWAQAHDLVQDDQTPDAARLHAYLHRKEGDLDNARYWYRRAHVDEFTGSFEAEWDALAGHLLAG